MAIKLENRNLTKTGTGYYLRVDSNLIKNKLIMPQKAYDVTFEEVKQPSNANKYPRAN